jgi:hypothetical protein
VVKNLITLKAGAKLELLLSKLVSGINHLDLPWLAIGANYLN